MKAIEVGMLIGLVYPADSRKMNDDEMVFSDLNTKEQVEVPNNSFLLDSDQTLVIVSSMTNQAGKTCYRLSRDSDFKEAIKLAGRFYNVSKVG